MAFPKCRESCSDSVQSRHCWLLACLAPTLNFPPVGSRVLPENPGNFNHDLESWCSDENLGCVAATRFLSSCVRVHFATPMMPLITKQNP
ncbi:hypothetical protein LX32DRAFT_636636 [Colletotrichum zoysiae]|uniref:Uncharacterized protein n=1 Tax=Colletotrichum zoysiae TaxID=1216348 RepID=A0AAD9HMX1_9PEZI|nr:hypothetical protein LX32DRAFT_636636 [Colletotrichum zoysiae]